MMKITLMFKKLLFILLLTSIVFQLNSQTNVENFNYSSSTLLTDASIGFSEKTNPPTISVSSPGLEYFGSAVSGIGNAALIETSTVERIAKKDFFASSANSGTVYLSFLANIKSSTGGDFNNFFIAMSDFNSNTLRGRVLAKDNGSGKVQFGFTKGFSSDINWTTTSYEYDETYLFVVKYEFVSGLNNDIASLFIFDAVDDGVPTTEPGSATLTANDGSGSDTANIKVVHLRQRTVEALVDGISLGQSWSDVIVDKLAVSSTAGNWNDTSTWVSGAVPSANEDVTIDHNITIPVDLNITNNIRIEDGSLTVNAGKSLTLSGDLITNNKVTLNSTSSTYSSLIVTGAITGNVSYSRFVNPYTPSDGNADNENDLISPPVNNMTFSAFVSANSNILDNGGSSPKIYAFAPFVNNTTADYYNYDSNTSVNLSAGKGYRVATNTLGDNKLTFTGEVLTASEGAVTSAITVGTDVTYGSWNLIGNPFPSYLSVTDFLNNTSNTSLLNESSVGIYGYNASTSTWTIYNLSNASDPDERLIAPGQGFFVSAESAGNIEFTSSMRRIGNSDDFIIGKTPSLRRSLAKVVLNRNGKTFSTDIYFIEGRTKGIDRGYDAKVFDGIKNSIYTQLVESNNDIELAIQALNYSDYNNVIVPLGIKSNAGETIQISLDKKTYSLPENIYVYLEDKQENSFTLLNSKEFELTPSTNLQDNGRFYLHFQSQALSNDDFGLNKVQIFSSNSKSIIVKGTLSNNSRIRLYDIQGRLVFQDKLDDFVTSNTVDVSWIQSGVYITVLESNSESKTQKIIIK